MGSFGSRQNRLVAVEEANPAARYRAVVRTAHVGDWGSLDVYEDDDEPPPEVGRFRTSWTGDPHRRAVVLRTATGGRLPLVAVWPSDGPPPVEGPLTAADLEGVVLAQPVSHRCAVCNAEVPGLYVDGGLPFFRPRLRPHDWLAQCPRCGADAAVARLTGMLPITTQ